MTVESDIPQCLSLSDGTCDNRKKTSLICVILQTQRSTKQTLQKQGQVSNSDLELTTQQAVASYNLF